MYIDKTLFIHLSMHVSGTSADDICFSSKVDGRLSELQENLQVQHVPPQPPQIRMRQIEIFRLLLLPQEVLAQAGPEEPHQLQEVQGAERARRVRHPGAGETDPREVRDGHEYSSVSQRTEPSAVVNVSGVWEVPRSSV